MFCFAPKTSTKNCYVLRRLWPSAHFQIYSLLDLFYFYLTIRNTFFSNQKKLVFWLNERATLQRSKSQRLLLHDCGSKSPPPTCHARFRTKSTHVAQHVLRCLSGVLFTDTDVYKPPQTPPLLSYNQTHHSCLEKKSPQECTHERGCPPALQKNSSTISCLSPRALLSKPESSSPHQICKRGLACSALPLARYSPITIYINPSQPPPSPTILTITNILFSQYQNSSQQQR
jgi:hypothetical protein